MNPELQKLLEQEWYTQGFAARPVFLVSCCGIDAMQKGAGFSYGAIPMAYREDYCKFNYPVKGLSANADLIMQKLDEDRRYLEKKRAQYNGEIEALEPAFRKAEEKSGGLSDEGLFETAAGLEPALDAANGTAHMIESVSFRLEKEIYCALGKKSRGKELNRDFSEIATPPMQSYLSKKEERIWEIKNAPAEKQGKLAEEFISDFFWLETNFAGSKQLTLSGVLEEAKKMSGFEKPDFVDLKEQKEELSKKYGFGETEKQWLELVELLAEWQDDRKRNMFRGVFALDSVLHEISRRHGIGIKSLHYLLAGEIQNAVKSKKAEKIAAKRIQGCVFVRKPGKTLFFGKKDFLEFEKAFRKEHCDVEVLTGMSASLGTATGPVRICTTMESLEKVREGDVLVASMTRPEFVMAMKKAAAIVTDEGGITCHAAIIARELGKPCVVATQNATKVLKDGDIVEVKANHGSVKKIS